MHWRRKWQPTLVFLPGESQGWGSLVGCRLWGRTEWDTTEATQQQQNMFSNLLESAVGWTGYGGPTQFQHFENKEQNCFKYNLYIIPS